MLLRLYFRYLTVLTIAIVPARIFAQAEYFTTTNGTDFYLGAKLVADQPPPEHQIPFTNQGLPDTIDYYLGDAFMVASDTTPVIVSFISSESLFRGLLSFMVPGHTDSSIELFSNHPNETGHADTAINLGTFPRGTEIVLKYQNIYKGSGQNPLPESTVVANVGTFLNVPGARYTGRNDSTESTYISEAWGPQYENIWHVAGRMNDTIVDFRFEDFKDMDFNDIVFQIQGVQLLSELSPPIVVECLPFSSIYIGGLYFMVPGYPDSARFLFTNQQVGAKADLGQYAEGTELVFMYENIVSTNPDHPVLPDEMGARYTGTNLPQDQYISDISSGQYGHRWAMAGKVSDTTVIFSFEDKDDYDFNDVRFLITGIATFQGDIPTDPVAYAHDSLIVYGILRNYGLQDSLAITDIASTSGGRITGLDLSNMDLPYFSPYIGNLTGLTSLNLSGNYFRDIHTNVVFDLTPTTVDLSNNCYTTAGLSQLKLEWAQQHDPDFAAQNRCATGAELAVPKAAKQVSRAALSVSGTKIKLVLHLHNRAPAPVVQLFNATGKLVAQHRLAQLPAGRHALDISVAASLTAGSYFARVRIGERTFVLPFALTGINR
ncbi:MAG: hypothetical protein GF398_05055 [Chitinivibrionales bacterium]|nr:hypothetical protein [Chitinivibrionales bacterium]